MTSVMMVTSFPPQDDGIGAHARDLRRALQAITPVSVLTRAGGGAGELDVHRVLSSSPTSLPRAIAVLRRSRPDVVHLQFNLPSFGVAWLWAVSAALVARRRFGARLVITLHEVRRDLAILGLGAKLMYRGLGRVADALVVYTDEAKELLGSRCGIDQRRVVVMPHGCPASLPPVDEARRPTVAARYELGRDPILCLGYLHPDKGIEHLLRAIAIMLREDPDALGGRRVVVAGKVRSRRGVFRFFEKKDRRYEAMLRRFVADARLEEVVRFVGPVEDDDLAAVLDLAGVAVLPYNDATQSGVLNLLLAAGTPVVMSRLPGLAGTVGDAGRYFDPGDAAGLAGELRIVLGDQVLRERLVEQMTQVREQVSYAAVAKRLRSLYASLRVDGVDVAQPGTGDGR